LRTAIAPTAAHDGGPVTCTPAGHGPFRALTGIQRFTDLGVEMVIVELDIWMGIAPETGVQRPAWRLPDLVPVDLRDEVAVGPIDLAVDDRHSHRAWPARDDLEQPVVHRGELASAA